MPNQWYAQIMGEEVGPMSGGQLKQMVAQKRIAPDDQVRKGGSGNWTTADRVKGLFSATFEKPKETVPLSTQVAVEVAERNLNKKPSRLSTCPDCDHQVSLQAASCPQCGRQMKEEIHYEQRSRGLAVALAWLVGMTGAHRFYMRESNGWLYLLGTLFMIGIPFVVLACILDGFRYLSAEDTYFKVPAKGNRKSDSHRRRRNDSPNYASGSWVRKLGFLIVIVVGASMIMSIVDSTDRSSTRRNTHSSQVTQIWYEGGTLHGKTALDWQIASSRNKLATCADLVASIPSLSNGISSVDELKPIALKLVKFIDEAYAKHPDTEMNQKMFANQSIASAAAIAFVSWGLSPE